MPILPLIDLLILMGTLNLGISCIIKLITLSTVYQPYPLGLGPLDFVVIAGICFLFALTLAARAWVKINEPQLMAARREVATAQARLRVAGIEGNGAEAVAGGSAEPREAAVAESR